MGADTPQARTTATRSLSIFSIKLATLGVTPVPKSRKSSPFSIRVMLNRASGPWEMGLELFSEVSSTLAAGHS